MQVPGPEKAEEDKYNREKVAEEELEKDVQAVHCVPIRDRYHKTVLRRIAPCGENADALAKGDDGGPDEELRDGRQDGDHHQG